MRMRMMTFWAMLFLCVAISLVGVRKALAQEESEDPGYLPNPQAVLNSTVVPTDFVMKESSYTNLDGTKGLLVTERWVAKPLPGFTQSRFINVKLYALKNRTEALQWAKGVHGASTERNQIKALGKADPGSYSGQTIGENCWAYGLPRPPVSNTSTLVVVQGRDMFSVQQVGERVEDSLTERIALFLVERLKQWPRPQ